MNGLLPEDTFEFVLPDDADKPSDAQRVLIFKHRTAGYWLGWSRTADEIGKEPDWSKRLAGYLNLLGSAVGARNLNLKDLANDLYQSELVVLALNVPGAAMLSEFDRKKSRSPLPSATEPPVADAAAVEAVR